MTDRIDKDTPPALAAILNLDNARRRARISKRIASVAPKHPPCKVIELTEGMGQHKIHTRTRTLKVGKREHSPLGPFSEIGEIVGGVWVFRPNGWDHWIYFV